MSLFRRLGREVERFRQLALAAAEETTGDQPASRCGECGEWIPARFDRCLECGARSPHAVLDVDPDAPDAVVRAAAREKIKSAHPDHGGSLEEFERVKRAREQLLDS